MKMEIRPWRVAGMTLLVLLAGLGTIGHGEKFQSSLSTDYRPQENQQSPANQPRLPQTPVLATTPAPGIPDVPLNTPVLALPSAPQTPLMVPTSSFPKIEITTPAVQKNPWDLRRVKITVPDYEKKYQDMIRQEAQMQAAKKKKTLMGSISEEVSSYGFLLILGLVIFIAIYVKRKERETVGQIPQAPSLPSQEEPKKNIWDEDF